MSGTRETAGPARFEGPIDGTKSGRYQSTGCFEADLTWEFTPLTGKLTIDGQGFIPSCFVLPAYQRKEGTAIDVDPLLISKICIKGKIKNVNYGAFIGCSQKSIDLELFTDGFIECLSYCVFGSEVTSDDRLEGYTPSTHPVRNLYIGHKADVHFSKYENLAPERVYYHGTNELCCLPFHNNPEIRVPRDYPWDNFQVALGSCKGLEVKKILPSTLTTRSMVPLSDLAAQHHPKRGIPLLPPIPRRFTTLPEKSNG